MARDVIALNRMFSGKYLEKNLGHEIINLYQSDNGQHYIYLNDDGRFNTALWTDRVYVVLLTADIGNNQEKVIGKAVISDDIYGNTDLYNVVCNNKGDNTLLHEQINFIVANGVKYGGTFLHNIFLQNDPQGVLLTFIASEFYEVKPDVEIILDYSGTNGNQSKSIIVPMVTDKANKSLRRYFEPDPKDKAEAQDYKSLADVIKNSSLWVKSSKKFKNRKLAPEEKRTIMDDLFRNRINENKEYDKLFEK